MKHAESFISKLEYNSPFLKVQCLFWPFFKFQDVLLGNVQYSYMKTMAYGNKNQQRFCHIRTGLVYFVAQREARPLVGIVRNKLDVDGRPRRYDGRRGDVAAVLPQQVSRLWVPVVDLNIIVSIEDMKMLNSCSATFVVIFPKTKDWQGKAKIK